MSKSKGKRHIHATTNQLTKILTFLRLEKQSTRAVIQSNANVPSDYVYPALHWLIFHGMIKKMDIGRETYYYLGRKRCSKK